MKLLHFPQQVLARSTRLLLPGLLWNYTSTWRKKLEEIFSLAPYFTTFNILLEWSSPLIWKGIIQRKWFHQITLVICFQLMWLLGDNKSPYRDWKLLAIKEMSIKQIISLSFKKKTTSEHNSLPIVWRLLNHFQIWVYSKNESFCTQQKYLEWN